VTKNYTRQNLYNNLTYLTNDLLSIFLTYSGCLSLSYVCDNQYVSGGKYEIYDSILFGRWYLAGVLVMSDMNDWVDFSRDVDYIAIFVVGVFVLVVLVVVAHIFIILIIVVILVGTLFVLWVLKRALLHLADVCDSPLDEVVSALLTLDLVTFILLVWNVEGGILNCASVLLNPLLPLLWVLFAPFALFLPCIDIRWIWLRWVFCNYA